MEPHSPEPCPPDSAWDELSAGLTPAPDVDVLLEHASWCAVCAAKLRDSIDIFSPEEDEAGPQLVSLSGNRHASNVTVRPPPTAWRRYAIALAAMFAMVLCGGAWLWWVRSHDPLTELARAYTSNRTIELRVPGAAYGPVRVERGGGALMGQSADRLEAAARIQRALSQSPHDPRWLHAFGRLAILEWRPQEAIRALEAARDDGDNQPAVLIDLATAYYEHARRESSPAGLHKAVELLGRVLKSDTGNPAALFNRALIEEELEETAAAVADLEEVLRVEPQGGWADETRKVLDRLRAKRGRFLERPPDSDRQSFDEIRLDALLTGDLMATRTGAEFAELARDFQQRHQDEWLAELASAPAASIDADEAQALNRMASIRLTVEKGRYEKESGFDLPRRIQPAPVAAWHQFEALYRATHARGPYRCPTNSDALLDLTEHRHYRWLTIQILREQGYCSFQRGDVELARKYGQRSIQLAEQAGYVIAAVRSTALIGHVAARRGQFAHALDVSHRALRQITAGRLPVSRSQEFYNLAMVSAEGLEWWHAARAAAASVTEAARIAGFRDLEFTGLVRWAQLTLRAGDAAGASALFGRALASYASLAPSTDRAWAEIGFAEATDDDRRLADFAATLENTPDAMLWVPYQRLRARFALSRGHLAEAHSRLERIVTWMNGHDSPGRAAGYRWQSEFRATGSVLLEVQEREGRIAESFDFRQQWLAADERSRSPVKNPAHVSDREALAFAFAAVGPRIAIWRCDASAIDFRWSSLDHEDAARLVRNFARLLETADSSLDEVGRLGLQIRTGLFGTWLDEIAPGRPVLIQVDDQALSNLAFAALPGRSRELGLEHPIAVTPFALTVRSVVAELPGRERFLLVDASDARADWAPELPALEGAKREVAVIRAVWPDAEMLHGDTAHPDMLARSLPGAALLHFAGHALLTNTGAALVLPGSQGSSDLLELSSDDSPAPPIVVLSACSTGKTTSAIPDTGSPQSLAAAFLLKGSGAVIASLWDVDSSATEELMRVFYTRLRAERETGRALQSAMVELRNSPRFSHPHYWAAFARFIRT